MGGQLWGFTHCRTSRIVYPAIAVVALLTYLARLGRAARVMTTNPPSLPTHLGDYTGIIPCLRRG